MARRPPERYPTPRNVQLVRIVDRSLWLLPLLLVVVPVALIWILGTILEALGWI